MTEPYGYDEQTNSDIEDSDRSVTLKRSQIRSMERDAKEARQAKQEAENLRRELYLARAGLSDLTERQQKALLASIDGDLTVDSVKEAATDLGFLKPEVPAEDPDRKAMEQMAQASAGASDPGSDDSVARLYRADREGGKDAVLRQIEADGLLATPSG